jgi:alkanesulfonate monooxygenase SsuD/methylene tetrahydromethanopterin reductase-like flavin-dependent oxidoreductase (luciferase family)
VRVLPQPGAHGEDGGNGRRGQRRPYDPGPRAGWHDPEYEAFGYPIDLRAARLEEALRIIVPLLRGERVSLDGRYHQVRDAELLPSPHRPIPILVAAKGSRMLRLTARYADAWNTAWFGGPGERLRERLADLEHALEVEARDPLVLRRTVGLEIVDHSAARPNKDPGEAFVGSVDELAHILDALEELGFADAIAVLQPMTQPSLDRVAKALELRR